MRILLLVLATCIAAPVFGQPLDDAVLSTPLPRGEGLEGFSDFDFMTKTFFNLTLAAVLGAIIGFHPRSVRTADTLQEVEAPKVDILYATIGALIGIMVVKYGLVIGFVLFGIGGLIRFRTVMRSTNLTGQVILVTLIGLSCGLDLPHVAVMATLFGWVLIYLLEWRITYQIDIRALPNDQLAESVIAYREALESQGAKIIGERKRPGQGRARFIFRPGKGQSQEEIQDYLEREVDPALRGMVNWEID
ncbi:MAG: MgtC/SapB family protein [Pseudomonadota bacterium]